MNNSFQYCIKRTFQVHHEFNLTIEKFLEVVALACDKAHSLISNVLTHLWCVINAYQLLFEVGKDCHDSHFWIY
jgi:hypothetical protein